jgi:hypothetical protein
MSMNKNLLNSHYRAVIKRVETFPNVSEFYTFKYSVDEYALIYGIEKVLRRIEVKAHTNGKSNKYLLKQFYRLSNHAIKGNKEAYAELSNRLMRESISFRLVAMNRKYKDWFLVNCTRKLRAVWKRLGGIINIDSGDINFKRVWIDKKPKDYARPLGVPTMEWRIFSWMKMEIIERYLKGAGKLQPWQHGGRSGVGVLSCWKALIPRIQESKWVYEFDIKGFFDNISHKSIQSEFDFEMGFMARWIKEVLKAKVKGYVLPPREEDLAIQRMKLGTRLYADKGHQDYKTVTYTTTTELMLEWIEFLKKEVEKLPEGFTYDIWIEPKDGSMVEAYGAKPFKNAYVGFMLNQGSWLNMVGPEGKDDRGKARDKWKGLNQGARGVPQGLGTSPLISTFMTDMRFSEIKNNILMYMDDGLLFADTLEEMKRVIKELKSSLRMMGLSIAKEKSGWIKQDGEWKQEAPKFLGMRFLWRENTIMSDTRSGTKVKFPLIQEWDKLSAMAAMNELSIPYMRKKYDRLLQTTAYEAGIKYGFLGCLIAEACYKDAPPMWVRKLEVRAGQDKRLEQIEKNRESFLWRSGDLEHWQGSIQTITSISCARLLNKRTRTKVMKYGAVGRGRKLLGSSTKRRP